MTIDHRIIASLVAGSPLLICTTGPPPTMSFGTGLVQAGRVFAASTSWVVQPWNISRPKMTGRLSESSSQCARGSRDRLCRASSDRVAHRLDRPPGGRVAYRTDGLRPSPGEDLLPTTT
ncbi:hypothetical protein ABZ370_26825 [Streptomyces sp. NPDC005962]|uniref:hypothetical protein n=1 Tax=Streptomyces sp. NPDC005962 TaxID=3154466 RepID=UPI0033FBD9DA